MAQAAHIVASKPGGPRGKDKVRLPDGSIVGRRDEANAVWLCMSCHYKVDSDEDAYPTELLVAWKDAHEKRVSSLVGLDLEESLIRLGRARSWHDRARELLQWLDGHRFMYYEGPRKEPDQVWRAVQALRQKLIGLRAEVADPQSEFGRVLAEVDRVVREFVRAVEPLRVDRIDPEPRNPEFVAFSRELETLRRRIVAASAPLARREGYEFESISQPFIEEAERAEAEALFNA